MITKKEKFNNKEEYFIGVGIGKTATTLIYELLKNHPKLNIGKVKELHYFDNTDSPSIEEYEQLFSGSKGIKFEITPIYIYFKDVLKKIAFILKNKKKKILIVLRNPVKRAQAHYFHSMRRGEEMESFEKSFDLEKKRIVNSVTEYRANSYFSRGLCYDKIKECYELFGKENVLILTYEDLKKDTQKSINEICDFISIDRTKVPEVPEGKRISTKLRSKYLNYIIKKNAEKIRKVLPARIHNIFSIWYRKINHKNYFVDDIDVSQEFLDKLATYYNDDIEKVEKLIDRKLGYKIENKIK